MVADTIVVAGPFRELLMEVERTLEGVSRHFPGYGRCGYGKRQTEFASLREQEWNHVLGGRVGIGRCLVVIIV